MISGVQMKCLRIFTINSALCSRRFQVDPSFNLQEFSRVLVQYYEELGGGVFRLIVTFLRCVKLSSMPSSENSRPMPLCFTPP